MIFKLLVFGYLRENGLLSSISLIAVALGVGAAIATDLGNASAMIALRASTDVVISRTNLQVIGPTGGFDERALVRVRRIQGVVEAQPIVDGAVLLNSASRQHRSPVTLHVVGVDLLEPLPRGAEIRRHLVGAFVPNGDEPAPSLLILGRGAIISAQVAKQYSLTTGRIVEASAHRRDLALRIAGILPRDLTAIDSSVMFVDIGTAQELFGKLGKLDRIDCIVDPEQLPSVQARIAALLPSGVHAVAAEDRGTKLRHMVLGSQQSLAVLSYVALLLSGLLVHNIAAISVVRRRPEIGTLRALGASRGQIFRSLLAEGATIGIAGGLIACPAAILAAELAINGLTPTLADTLGLSTLQAPLMYDGFAVVIKAILVGVALVTLSIVGPAISAAWTRAALTLRSPRTSAGADSLLARLALAGSAIVGLGFALTFAAPLQYGVAGYAAGVAFISGFSLCVPYGITSLTRLVRRASDRMPPAIILAATNLRSSTVRVAIAVASLTLAVAVTVSVVTLVTSVSTSVNAWVARTMPGDLLVQAATPLTMPTALETQHLAAQIGADRDVARVRTIALAGGSFQPPLDAIAVFARPGANLIEVRARLLRAVPENRITVAITRELRTNTLALFDRTSIAMYSLGTIALLIAIGGIVVALYALVLEGKREVGVLRYVGLQTGSVRSMVLYESALVGLLSGTLGTTLGLLLACLALRIVGRQAPDWQIDLRVPFGALAATLAVVLASALLAGFYPASVAARIRTGEAVWTE